MSHHQCVCGECETRRRAIAYSCDERAAPKPAPSIVELLDALEDRLNDKIDAAVVEMREAIQRSIDAAEALKR
jgi:hypothetical protein